MKDADKTKDQLMRELVMVRQHIAKFKRSENKRTRNEYTPHANESQYKDLLDLLPAVVFELDEKSNIRFANRQGFETFGYAPEELEKGLSILQLVVPEERDKLKQNIRKIINGEKKTSNEYTALRKDGSTFPVVAYSSPIIVENRPVGLRGIVVDVTASRQMEETLRESEEKFRAFMETASDLMNITDKNLNLTYVNDSMARTLGYSKQEMVGMHITQLLRKEDVAKDFKQNTEELITKGKFSFETKWVTKDGKEIQGELKVVAIYDNDGTFAGTRGVFHDLTEQKKAIEELRQSEERYRSLVENIDLGIILIDAVFNIVMINSAESKLLKIPKSGLLGKKCFRVFEKRDEVCPHCPGIRAKVTGQPVEATTEVVSSDGSRMYARLQAFPVFDQDGTATGFIEVVEDITERKQVEQHLSETRIRYHTLFDNTPVGIGVTTIDGHILTANQAMHQMTGYSEADMEKLNMNDIYKNIEDRKLLLKLLTRNKPVRDFEVSMKRKDNSSLDVSLTINRISVDGKESILTMMRDITVHKKAEKKLQEYQKQLRSLATELSLAEERGRRCVSMYLHDHIGNSLAMCKIKLGLLQKSLPPIHHDGQLEEIEGIIEQVIQGVRSLTSDLSSPVLYEMGLVAAVEWLSENISKQYGMQITVKNTGQFKKLDSDLQVLLFQTVRELLTNIIKHSQAQKVEIYIQRCEENRIHIEVKDNGVGFDTSRLLSSITQSGSVGLFNIRERFNHLGGDCNIESQPGCGTRVTIIAPLKITD